MNVQLLREVQKRILDNPESLYMSHWKCGATACIAGHALDIVGAEWVKYDSFDPPRMVVGTSYTSTQAAGAEALGLTPQQADELFHVEKWPQTYVDDYYKTRWHRDRALIASARIDAFIEQYAPTDETLPESGDETTTSTDHQPEIPVCAEPLHEHRQDVRGRTETTETV